MSEQQPKPSSPPIPNSYAIPTGVGFAGQYPRELSEAASRKKINAILDAGVTVFLDLTELDEPAREGPLLPYVYLLEEEAARRNVRVTQRRFSVPDQRIPHAKSRMTEILDAIDDAEGKGHRVYLHCWGGKGRTGTAVACHLIRRGSAVNDALQTVQRLAHGMPQAKGLRVPENDAQCNFVRAWSATD